MTESVDSGGESSLMRSAVERGRGGTSTLGDFPSGRHIDISLDDGRAAQPPQRTRVLLVGNHCISKDVAAKLRRAGYSLARFEDAAAGMEAAAAVQFDFVVIDGDGMDEAALAEARDAFGRRGLKIIAVMAHRARRGPCASPEAELEWRLLTKPVAFEALVAALQR